MIISSNISNPVYEDKTNNSSQKNKMNLLPVQSFNKDKFNKIKHYWAGEIDSYSINNMEYVKVLNRAKLMRDLPQLSNCYKGLLIDLKI